MITDSNPCTNRLLESYDTVDGFSDGSMYLSQAWAQAGQNIPKLALHRQLPKEPSHPVHLTFDGSIEGTELYQQIQS